MSNCLCGEGARNLGVLGCTGNANYAVKFGFVQRKANDGTINGIDLSTDELNDAYFEAWVNQEVKSKRLYPTGAIVNVTDERGDPITYDANGVSYFASEGNRTLNAEIIEGASPKLAEALNSMRCVDMTVYNFSVSKQIVGNGRDEDKLYGFRIESNTLYAKFQAKTRELPAKIMLSFTISTYEDDKDISYIDYTPKETGAGRLQSDVLELSGLLDVVLGAASGITTTSFTSTMTYVYGPQGNKNKFVGATLADFYLWNEDGEEEVVITSVTETEAGVSGEYVFVYPAVAPADVLTLSLTKIGYEEIQKLTIDPS